MVVWGGGYPSPYPLPSPRRLRRLDLGAFGASASTPSSSRSRRLLVFPNLFFRSSAPDAEMQVQVVLSDAPGSRPLVAKIHKHLLHTF